MPVIFLFRSITYAQRGLRVLQQAGVPASIVKAPMGASPRGCSQGLRISGRFLADAVLTLRNAGISWESAILLRPDGSFTEAEL